MGRSGQIRSHYTVWLVLAILALIVYSRSFDNGFRQDDFAFLRHVENTSVLDAFRPSSDFAFYRPGSLLLFRAEYVLFGYDAGAYIAFNFFLHLLVSILIIFVFQRLNVYGGSGIIVAGLYLLGFGHYGKTVMWACCSGQIAAVILSLAGMLAALRWAGCGEGPEDPAGGRAKGYLAAAVVSMTVAVLFHEIAFITPVLAAIAVLSCGRKGAAPSWRGAAVLLIPIPLFLAKCLVLSGAYPAYGLGDIAWSRIPGYLLRYAGFAVIPVQETSIVDLPASAGWLAGSLPAIQTATGAILLLVLGYLAATRRNWRRLLCIWFPLAILQFTLVRLPDGWLQLRYLYFAAIPLCGLAGAGFLQLLDSGKAARRIAAVILLVTAAACTSVLVLLLETHYAAF